MARQGIDLALRWDSPSERAEAASGSRGESADALMTPVGPSTARATPDSGVFADEEATGAVAALSQLRRVGHPSILTSSIFSSFFPGRALLCCGGGRGGLIPRSGRAALAARRSVCSCSPAARPLAPRRCLLTAPRRVSPGSLLIRFGPSGDCALADALAGRSGRRAGAHRQATPLRRLRPTPHLLRLWYPFARRRCAVRLLSAGDRVQHERGSNGACDGGGRRRRGWGGPVGA